MERAHATFWPDEAVEHAAAGIDVPFLSILTPFKGTPLHAELERDGRILADRGWEHYNGFNAGFRPRRMSPDDMLEAHRHPWRKAFSPSHVAKRMWRGIFRLRLGAPLMSLAMNAFYGFKALTGNEPVDMSKRSSAATTEAGRSARRRYWSRGGPSHFFQLGTSRAQPCKRYLCKLPVLWTKGLRRLPCIAADRVLLPSWCSARIPKEQS